MDITNSDDLGLLLVVANVLLVLVTVGAARAAKRSADAAAAELRLARRPLVLISECNVSLPQVNELGPYLVARVTFEDAAGVPSTLHSAKIAIHLTRRAGVPEELASGLLLYRSLKYVAEKTIDYESDYVESDDAREAEVEVTYLFSAEGDHRCQEWHCRTQVYRASDGYLCRSSRPRITRDDWRDEHERRQYWRRFVRWWQEMKAEMGARES